MGVSAGCCKGTRRGVVRIRTLVPNDQAIAVPKEDLRTIATPVEKQEQVPGERILIQEFPHRRHELIKAFPHVGGPSAEKDAHGRRDVGEH